VGRRLDGKKDESKEPEDYREPMKGMKEPTEGAALRPFSGTRDEEIGSK